MSPDEISALIQVIFVDIVLAGDNAIVVGMAAAGLPPQDRGRVIVFGIAAAAIMRVGFALVTVQLLAIIGLMLAGGILLLWVCWKLWRELRSGGHLGDEDDEFEFPQKTRAQAIGQIVIADLSMSLDNVLAVAGIARDHTWVLIVGLALSVVLMGVAATLVARLLNRYRFIGYIGLVVILYVAIAMIWEGGHEVMASVATG